MKFPRNLKTINSVINYTSNVDITDSAAASALHYAFSSYKLNYNTIGPDDWIRLLHVRDCQDWKITTSVHLITALERSLNYSGTDGSYALDTIQTFSRALIEFGEGIQLCISEQKVQLRATLSFWKTLCNVLKGESEDSNDYYLISLALGPALKNNDFLSSYLAHTDEFDYVYNLSLLDNLLFAAENDPRFTNNIENMTKLGLTALKKFSPLLPDYITKLKSPSDRISSEYRTRFLNLLEKTNQSFYWGLCASLVAEKSQQLYLTTMDFNPFRDFLVRFDRHLTAYQELACIYVYYYFQEEIEAPIEATFLYGWYKLLGKITTIPGEPEELWSKSQVSSSSGPLASSLGLQGLEWIIAVRNNHFCLPMYPAANIPSDFS